MTNYLDFEKPLAEIEGKAEELRAMARATEGMDVEAEAGAAQKAWAKLDAKSRAALLHRVADSIFQQGADSCLQLPDLALGAQRHDIDPQAGGRHQFDDGDEIIAAEVAADAARQNLSGLKGLGHRKNMNNS